MTKMFWRKIKNKKTVDDQAEPSDIKILRPQGRVDSLILRRNILEWRDKHTAQIELHLRSEITALMSQIDRELDTLSLIKSTIKIRQITEQKIQPLLSDWISGESEYLLQEARDDLLGIHELVLGTIEHGKKIEVHDDKEYLVDFISVSSVGICGLSVIPLFSSASVIGAGGLAGLFGATMVSLPILGAGLLLASLSIAVCGHKLSGLKARALKRYRDHLSKAINSSILGGSDRKEPSLSDQLQKIVLLASNDILSEIK